jgi:nitrogen regulatory protein P-II 1
MKHLTLIIHTDAQHDMASQLYGMEVMSGFTFTQVEGHGLEVAADSFLSAREKAIGHIPRVRVDILLEDENVGPLLKVLRTSIDNLEGNGIYWVTEVEQSGRL